MRIRAHVATSAILGGVLSYLFKSIPVGLGAFLSGILIDLDHLLDCYLNYGWKFNPLKTISICHNHELKKLYFFLHSYELLLAYVVAIFFLKKFGIWFGAAAGIALHLMLDNIRNPMVGSSYFLFYRYSKKFEMSKFLKQDELLSKRNKEGRPYL